MDYYNKYCKYKTKYSQLKYTNQYGGANEFVCVLDPEGGFNSYADCLGMKSLSPLSDHTSKLLFIGLPIAQTSDLGKEIFKSIFNMTNTTPFTDYAINGTNLCSPHISLISIYIPKDSKLDKLLSNENTFQKIMAVIKDIFIHHFGVNRLEFLELHSKINDYTLSNEWIVRVYGEEKYVYYVSEYINNFKYAIINYLSDNYNLNKQAILSWFTISTPWKPHLYLAKNTQPLSNFIHSMKQKPKQESFISLWSVNITKTLKREDTIERQGSLEYIYGAYDKHKLYIKI